LRLAIFYFDLLHYHVARCAALIKLAQAEDHKVFVYSMRPKSPDLPIVGYQDRISDNVRILLPNDQISLNSKVAANAIISALEHDMPDAVAIPGYRTRLCMAALTWCRRNARTAILLSESRREDYRRFWWKEQLKRLIVSQFDSAVVGGTPQAKYTAELGIPIDRIFLGYDVVDNEFWAERTETVRNDPSHWRNLMGLPGRYFLAVGRFIPKKNFEGLIRAYARYHNTVGERAWRLVICGTGPLEGKLRNLVIELEQQEYIYFVGYMDAEQLSKIYGLASTFVHASAYAEQWGLVVNEAMAAGLPVLVSRTVGCVHDLVREGVNGYTFDPLDIERLAQLLAQVSSASSDKLVEMGIASKAIIADWSPERFARSILQAAEVGRDSALRKANLWWIRVFPFLPL
jgi:glycosyltransferase involved in cell wall biosynthesis